MPAKKDLTGKTFNRLTVIEQDMEKSEQYHQVFWKCVCQCGNIKSVRAYDLAHGKTQSCGCLRNEKVRYAIANKLDGQRFGRLTVIKPVDSIKEESGELRTAWQCKCDCGNIIIVKTINLKSGDTKSCGCIHSHGETIIEQLLRESNIDYSQQYTFADLITPNGGYLKFDFAIFNKNHVLRYLIEFNGKQHYEAIDFFGGEEGLKKQIRNDKLKVEYCIKNKIPLIIIPYYELKDISLPYLERRYQEWILKDMQILND